MIKVNNREVEWWENMTIRDMLKEQKYTSPRIVVKVNDQVIRKQDWDTYTINDGDTVKAIHLIAGG
ncbi:MAG: sulfur carrier protein ThiS [Anaerolineales bacterium]|nr:sulfur carrier protein ThiS [Anaerolineales bacterium]